VVAVFVVFRGGFREYSGAEVEMDWVSGDSAWCVQERLRK